MNQPDTNPDIELPWHSNGWRPVDGECVVMVSRMLDGVGGLAHMRTYHVARGHTFRGMVRLSVQRGGVWAGREVPLSAVRPLRWRMA